MIKSAIHQGTSVEATVVQLFNQGTIRQKGCNPRLNDTVGQVLSGSFFGYFFGQAKNGQAKK
jgi:hypothetical protein